MTVKITTLSKDLVAEAIDVLQALARYGAWVEPVGHEPSDTLICGKDRIRDREHEVAGQLITSLERVDLTWLFVPVSNANDPLIRVSQAWARALLPSTHSLHAPLSIEDRNLLDQVRRNRAGEQNHDQ